MATDAPATAYLLERGQIEQVNANNRPSATMDDVTDAIPAAERIVELGEWFVEEVGRRSASPRDASTD